MKKNSKIQKAMQASLNAHHGQTRKLNSLPYALHSFCVAAILLQYTDDEDIICASLLHDVLEESDFYTYSKLKKEFGKKITDIVRQATDTRISYKDYSNKLKNASDEALMVIAADKIDNLKSIIKAGKKIDPWKYFSTPKKEKIRKYNNLLSILKTKLDSGIVTEFEALLKKTR